MKTPIKRTAALYLRVSSSGESAKRTSLRDQEKSLLNFCKLQNVKATSIVAEGLCAKKIDVPNGI